MYTTIVFVLNDPAIVIYLTLQEIRKARAEIEQEKVDKGLQLIPGSRLSKQEIQKLLGKEEKCMLKEERMKVAGKTKTGLQWDTRTPEH